jgi:sulfate transport system substrate-binding protein
MKSRLSVGFLGIWLAAMGAFVPGCDKGNTTDGTAAKSVTLLNVSYDPTHELYDAINAAFARQWKDQKGQDVTIQHSHGGSGKQARAVIDGLDADVVTLGLAYDIDAIRTKGQLINDANWQSRLPHESTPFTSTIVFLVRKGNPKQVKDWDDLIDPAKTIQIVVPDPRSSGGARWAYLAAWGYSLRKHNNSEDEARKFVGALYARTLALPSGARDATNLFTSQGQGDVLLAWENEALLASTGPSGKDKYEVVTPSTSILAEPPVAVVDKVVDKHGTREIAEAYLKFLYTDDAQEIAAANFYRPTTDSVLQKHAAQFASIPLFSIRDLFGDGGWTVAQKTHFEPGGVFEQIYKKK